MRKLVRPRQGRVFAGVCLALANYVNVDVTVMRIIWVILLLPGGLPGILPYLVLAVLIPSEQ